MCVFYVGAKIRRALWLKDVREHGDVFPDALFLPDPYCGFLHIPQGSKYLIIIYSPK